MIPKPKMLNNFYKGYNFVIFLSVIWVANGCHYLFKYSPEISKNSQIIFLYPSRSIPNKGYMASLKSLFSIEEVVQRSIKTYSSHEIKVAIKITANNHKMQISIFLCTFKHNTLVQGPYHFHSSFKFFLFL